MLTAVVLFVIGLALLIVCGDWFVDGSVGIAKRFHVPELLIGATVVSIGTTLPEVMVSASAAVQNHSEIAYGNAIGSVICNTALIAALTAAIRPSSVDRTSLRLPTIFFFIAAVLYAGIAYTGGSFTRFSGILLLSIFLVYFTLSARRALTETPKAEASEEAETPLLKSLLLMLVGAAGIAIGANLLVENGTLIAAALGVPESVIALTFVALGTSLPELTTAITALVKGHSALSLGNVVGANLFNLVLVSGAAITIRPFSLPQEKTLLGVNASLAVDVPLMFLVMVILTLPTLRSGKLRRWQGVLLLSLYAAFCVFQFAS
ncbi:MAG: calcium/sodium antiporter [Oscillospiraceae bacterium]|nr:calcium/sodium antiporter [Oscillospiraceae bacterium]